MLKRDIGKWELVLLVVNGIIGAGIFGLPSKVFALSGIYSLLALFVCALAVLIFIFAFAEVGSRFQKTGGPYLYTLEAFGPVAAFVIGWLLFLTRISGFAALVNLFVTYLSYFNPVFLEFGYKALVILVVTGVLGVANYRGIRTSMTFNNVLSISKLLPLLVFVGVGLFFVQPELLDFRQEVPNFGDFSTAVFVLIFAFTGFEATVVNTGEFKNPARNIPFALICSLLFVAVFYMGIQWVSIGTLPGLASSEKPLVDAAQQFMGTFGGVLVGIGALISIAGTLNAIMLIGSRIPYALSEEGQLPKSLGYVHPKMMTPVNSLLLFVVIALAVSLSGSFIYAVSINVISKVLIFMVVCAVLIRLRKSDTDQVVTYFKAPYGRILAIAGILVALWLLLSASGSDFVDVLIASLGGLLLYGGYWSLKKRRENS